MDYWIRLDIANLWTGRLGGSVGLMAYHTTW